MDHFLAAALTLLLLSSASTMLRLYVLLHFSNAKASRVMRLHTHICHDAPCLLPLTIPGTDLLFRLS